MSVFLNRDEIKSIDSSATQRKILDAVAKCVKELGATAEAIAIDIYPATEEPVFTKDSSFFKLIGSFEGPANLAEDHDHYLTENNDD